MAGSNDSSTLSMQQAANLLNVSSSYFNGLLSSGEIAFRTVGTDSSVLAKDVAAYKERED